MILKHLFNAEAAFSDVADVTEVDFLRPEAQGTNVPSQLATHALRNWLDPLAWMPHKPPIRVLADALL